MKIASLVIELSLVGLEEKNISFIYITHFLNKIDSMTCLFHNEKEFFSKRKEDIQTKLNKNLAQYNVNFFPIDIELKSIYILKDGKKIKPLFQEIVVQKEIKKLDDLVKEKLKENKLYLLYKCDQRLLMAEKYNEEAQNRYISIFNNVSKYILEKIELNLLSDKDYEYLFNVLKQNCYYYSIVRFILANNSNSLEDNIDQFKNEIANFDTKNNESIISKYRSPYKED